MTPKFQHKVINRADGRDVPEMSIAYIDAKTAGTSRLSKVSIRLPAEAKNICPVT
jgi:hypothetical protein